MKENNPKRLCYHASEKEYGATIDFARSNRSRMTAAEQALWQRIRKRQLDGHRFRRQHIIERFIVDFVCLEKALIVEVNGGYHYVGDQPRRDEERRLKLQEAGFRTIVFTNKEVLEEMDRVLGAIRHQLV